MTPRQSESGGSGTDALGDFAFEAGEDLLEPPALAEFHADGAVARQRTGAGEDEIAQAGQSGKSLFSAAAGDGEACHFRDAPGNEGGITVESEA